MQGSPPLTRGKAGCDLPFDRLLRITPAYAGKSRPIPLADKPERDHPRLRGEKFGYSMMNFAPAGSPPLTRGKGRKRERWAFRERITPAYAGKSMEKTSPVWYHGDHPRLRGEKTNRFQKGNAARGSPPLTRGKVDSRSASFALRRITPAYAGKSYLYRVDAQCPKDHPRLRGEKDTSDGLTRRLVGSPPLTRGKDMPDPKSLQWSRITPAYAGKSAFARHR